jgi:hypothetical protein
MHRFPILISWITLGALCVLFATIVGCSGSSSVTPNSGERLAGTISDTKSNGASDDIAISVLRPTKITPGVPYALLYKKRSSRRNLISTDTSTPGPWTADTEDECATGSVCAVQGISAPSWGIGVVCNGNVACEESSYTPYISSPPPGVTAVFSPSPIMDGGVSWSTISSTGATPVGTINLNYFFMISGPGPGPAGNVVPVQFLCGIALGKCPILDVTDEDLSPPRVISASPSPSTIPWVVGLQKNLSAAIRIGSGTGTYPTIVSTTWTAPTNAVASYTFGASTTLAPTPLPSPTGPTLTFYWNVGSNSVPNVFSVAQVVTRSDGGETAIVGTSVAYLVEMPTSVSVKAPITAPTIGPFIPDPGPSPTPHLSFGSLLNAPTSAGIYVTLKATAPNISQGAGYLGISQIVTAAGSPPPAAPPFLDACPLQDNAVVSGVVEAQPATKVAKGASGTASFFDAPNQPLLVGGPSPTTDSDSFVDYMVYRPAGKNAIWVSIGFLTWNWSGTATYSKGTLPYPWVLSAPSRNVSSLNTSVPQPEPTWNSTYNPGVDCPSLPTS